jgi:hypothetical protein
VQSAAFAGDEQATPGACPVGPFAPNSGTFGAAQG